LVTVRAGHLTDALSVRYCVQRDTGLTAADAWAIADDRSTWRALRPTAGYAQQWISVIHRTASIFVKALKEPILTCTCDSMTVRICTCCYHTNITEQYIISMSCMKIPLQQEN